MLKFLKNLFIYKHRDNPKDHAEQIAEIVVKRTNERLEVFELSLNNRLKELQSQIHLLDTNINLIDKKLSLKELKDKQSYGHMKYKIEELSSN